MLPMLLKDIDFIDKFFTPQFDTLKTRFPKCNVYIDEDDSLQFEFALAGFTKDEIKVSFETNKLIVVGSKEKKELTEAKKIFQQSIAYRDFEISYMVPAYYGKSIPEAKYIDGILYVTLQKDEVPEKKYIEIK